MSDKEPTKGDLITVRIPKWLAKNKEVDTTLKGKIEEESEKAWQIKGVWVPKSQVRIVDLEKGEEPKEESEDSSRMMDIRRQVALKAAVRALKFVYGESEEISEEIPEEEVIDSTRRIARGFLEWLEEE